MIVLEDLDRRAESNGLPVVPHVRMSLVGIDEPSEAVAHQMAIFFGGCCCWSHRPQSWLHFFSGEQSVFAQSGVPACHIRHRGVDAAIAQGRRRRTLIGLSKNSALGRVSICAVVYLTFPFLVRDRRTHF